MWLATTAVTPLAQSAQSVFHRVDIVMSNIGVIAMGLPLEIPVDAGWSSFDMTVLVTVRVLQAFLPSLLEQGSGHVVTTASTAGLFPVRSIGCPMRLSNLPLRTLGSPTPREGRSALQGSDVLCFWALASLSHIVFDLLAFLETLESVAHHIGEVDEDVLLPRAWRNEPEALVVVEELHCSSCHVRISLSFFWLFRRMM
jgi:short chain dehydrogenase